MSKRIVLYVDDEPEALGSLKTALEDRGYQVLTAGSGSEAVKVLKSKTPDVIIADLRMQPMNGFELFQEVRKNPKFVKTPFLFLTAVDDFLSRKYGQKLGVDAYITKPVDVDDLDSVIVSKLRDK